MMEAIDPRLETTVTGDLEKQSTCKVIWIFSAVRPNQNVRKLRVGSYEELAVKLKIGADRQRRNKGDAAMEQAYDMVCRSNGCPEVINRMRYITPSTDLILSSLISCFRPDQTTFYIVFVFFKIIYILICFLDVFHII